MAEVSIIKTIQQSWLKFFKQGKNSRTKVSEVNNIDVLKDIEDSLAINLMPKELAKDYEVYVELWLEEMNSVNVTLFCDKLFNGMNNPQGYFFLRTDFDDMCCLALWNIEEQSSGFRMVDVYKDGKYGYIVMQVCPKDVKKKLIIPNKGNKDGLSASWLGFVHESDLVNWFQQRDKLSKPEIPTHLLSTKKYGNKYILNFSVVGEFDLDIFYIEGKGYEPKLVFSRGFCCK